MNFKKDQSSPWIICLQGRQWWEAIAPTNFGRTEGTTRMRIYPWVWYPKQYPKLQASLGTRYENTRNSETNLTKVHGVQISLFYKTLMLSLAIFGIVYENDRGREERRREELAFWKWYCCCPLKDRCRSGSSLCSGGHSTTVWTKILPPSGQLWAFFLSIER